MLTLWERAHASPIGTEYQQELFAEVTREEWSDYVQNHQPPAKCEYCSMHVLGQCRRNQKRKYSFDKCEKYEWNGQPENEEERYMRLYPDYVEEYEDDAM